MWLLTAAGASGTTSDGVVTDTSHRQARARRDGSPQRGARGPGSGRGPDESCGDVRGPGRGHCQRWQSIGVPATEQLAWHGLWPPPGRGVLQQHLAWCGACGMSCGYFRQQRMAGLHNARGLGHGRQQTGPGAALLAFYPPHQANCAATPSVELCLYFYLPRRLSKTPLAHCLFFARRAKLNACLLPDVPS